MRKLKSALSSKKVIILLVVLVVAGVGAYAFHRSRADDTPVPTITAKDGKKIKLTPATDDEKQEVEDHKSDLAKREAQLNGSSSSQNKSVDVVITSPSASNPSGSGVRAYVSGVFEEGGVCTATATKGSVSVTKASTGFGNVSYTQCAPIDWDTPLSTGKWTIEVAYKSASASGVKSVTIEVK